MMPADVCGFKVFGLKYLNEGIARVAAWIWPPACTGCFARLSPQTKGPILCAQCFAGLPLWRRDEILPPALHRSVDTYVAPYLYEGVVRELLLRVKFKDATGVVPLLAFWLKPYVPVVDNVVLVPVPAHAKRVRERGYSQTVMLVQVLGKMTGAAYKIEGMKRLVPSDGQVARTRKQRLKMRSGDFWADPVLKDKHVVLVDDILTTGGTANACAAALKKAGVGRVDVLTIAYTPPASEYLPDTENRAKRLAT